jgi:hypothetical protein
VDGCRLHRGRRHGSREKRGGAAVDEIGELVNGDGPAGVVVECRDEHIDVRVRDLQLVDFEAHAKQVPKLLHVQYTLPIVVPPREHLLRRGAVAGCLELRLQLLGHRLVDRQMMPPRFPGPGARSTLRVRGGRPHNNIRANPFNPFSEALTGPTSTLALFGRASPPPPPRRAVFVGEFELGRLRLLHEPDQLSDPNGPLD